MNDLIASTKAYLLQNYTLSDRIYTDQETYRYFVDFAMQNKEEVKVLPPKKTPPPPVQPAIKLKPMMKPVAKPKESAPQTKNIEIVPQEKPAEIDLADLKKVFHSKFPNIAIIDTPPDDIIAKQRKKKEAEIIVISTNDNPKENAFLHHLANAIDKCYAPTSVFTLSEVEGQNPKLFIGTDDTLPKPNLKLEPVSNYLKDPSLKAKLWKELQQKLNPIS